ncbi:hypothetical protein IRJ41_024713, partial [Triplophysa rosa]
EETPDRWRITRVSDAVRKHHVVSLRPAPLFRLVGLTGPSASLPPHRRLRSVVHDTPNTSTAAGPSDHLWTGRPGPQPRTNPFSAFTGKTQEKPLAVNKTSNLQTLPQKCPKRLKEKDRKVDGSRWHHSDITSRERQEDTEYFYEEVWRGERQKVRWTRINRTKRINTDQVPDISQRIQSLEITDRAESHQSRSIGQMKFKPRGRGNRAVPLGKGEESTRRDRRPHFLPPLTQRDCLLNVPLTLPDNSPPPSPCSPSDVLFLPLSVPHIQPFPLRAETHE